MSPVKSSEPRILFVDDEPNVLDGLRRLLHPLRRQWRLSFAGGSAEALRMLASDSFDAIVTDVQMPNLRGGDLLARVARDYPQTVRVILSGMRDSDLLLAATSAHRVLKKPCNPKELQAALEIALFSRNIAANPTLQKVILQTESLPSVPSVYLEFVEATRDPDVSLHRLSGIVSKDMAITTKLLQIVNSPLFAPRHPVVNTQEACSYLGIENIQALLLSVSIFSRFGNVGMRHLSIDALQKHSLRVAALAKAIAARERLPRTSVDECFLAGMLHDIGKLILADNCAEDYDACLARAVEQRSDPLDTELATFGVTHADVGMYLLRLWGLADSVAQGVAEHHISAIAPLAPSRFRIVCISPMRFRWKTAASRRRLRNGLILALGPGRRPSAGAN
ncbi:MAG: response regulator [Bryobacteraceae bacterium]